MVLESTETSQVPSIEYRNQSDFLYAVCKEYKSESLLAKALAHSSHYPQFKEKKNGLLYMRN